MAAFQELHVKRYAKPDSLNVPENKHWRKFQSPVIIKEHSPVNYVHCSPVKPHDFVVTCSGKIQVFSQATQAVKKEITRFKDFVYGTRFRSDGQLLVCGGEQGLIQVFDVNSRAILRHLKGHTRATHVTSFSSDVSRIISASDDKTVRLWDMAAEKELMLMNGHEDYIRCGVQSLASENIFVTGSYDHTVRLWDTRHGKTILSLQHDAPVENVLLFPTGGICLSAGSNYIKAWDILGGGRLLFSFSNHQKTITSLCFNGDCTRLLSGSLDRQVKVYDVQDYSIVGNIDYSAAVLSLAMSPDGNQIVAGLSDNLISIRKRVTKEKDTTKSLFQSETKRGTHDYMMRGQASKPQQGDIVVKHKQGKKFRDVDRHLKKFEFRAALDSVLRIGYNHPPLVVTVMQELSRRGALRQALDNRTASQLVAVMHFLVKNACNPRYSNVLLDVANMVVDIYTPVIGQSASADRLFTSLKNSLGSELKHQNVALGILGALDTLFAASSTAISSPSS